MEELVRLKYTAGRSFVKVPFQRKPYVWKKETGYICDVPKDFASQLLQTGQFEPVSIVVEKSIEVPNKLKCDKCDFVAKTEQGLIVHKSKKH